MLCSRMVERLPLHGKTRRHLRTVSFTIHTNGKIIPKIGRYSKPHTPTAAKSTSKRWQRKPLPAKQCLTARISPCTICICNRRSLRALQLCLFEILEPLAATQYLPSCQRLQPCRGLTPPPSTSFTHRIPPFYPLHRPRSLLISHPKTSEAFCPSTLPAFTRFRRQILDRPMALSSSRPMLACKLWPATCSRNFPRFKTIGAFCCCFSRHVCSLSQHHSAPRDALRVESCHPSLSQAYDPHTTFLFLCS